MLRDLCKQGLGQGDEFRRFCNVLHPQVLHKCSTSATASDFRSSCRQCSSGPKDCIQGRELPRVVPSKESIESLVGAQRLAHHFDGEITARNIPTEMSALNYSNPTHLVITETAYTRESPNMTQLHSDKFGHYAPFTSRSSWVTLCRLAAGPDHAAARCTGQVISSPTLLYQDPRTTQRKPMCEVEVSTASPWRAAGR
jgi:hypothetical protein